MAVAAAAQCPQLYGKTITRDDMHLMIPFCGRARIYLPSMNSVLDLRSPSFTSSGSSDTRLRSLLSINGTLNAAHLVSAPWGASANVVFLGCLELPFLQIR